MNWHTFLTISHIIGTALGVGGATFAEIFYLKAIKDGVVEPTETDFLRTTYKILRLGLIILVLSGFGYLLLYRLSGQPWIYSPRVWAKLTATLVILFNALLIQARKMPMWLGSSLSLTSWYAALIIGSWRFDASYAYIMLIYAIAIIIIALALTVIRKLVGIKT